MARNNQKPAPQLHQAPDFLAWHVTDKGEKSYWNKVGAAWAHKDSKGFTLQLEVMAINGRIVLRQPLDEPLENKNQSEKKGGIIMTQALTHCGGYHVGHPWYFRLGGAIPSPKQIEAEVEAEGYRGYLAGDIDAIAAKSEPQRSDALRALREQVLDDLRKDLSRYRECAQELCRFRRAGEQDDRPLTCDIYTAISLKCSHLTNRFANLRTIDVALSVQGDLFGF